jgi:hypothetical protein
MNKLDTRHLKNALSCNRCEMADLLEKRGFDITFLGLEADGAIQVAGVLVQHADDRWASYGD